MTLGAVVLSLGLAVTGAITVRWITRLVAGFLPGFGKTIVVVIVGLAAGTVAAELVARTLLRTADTPWASIAVVLVAFTVNTLAIALGVRSPGGGRIGVVRACLVSAVQYAVYIALFAAMPGPILRLVGAEHIGM